MPTLNTLKLVIAGVVALAFVAAFAWWSEHRFNKGYNSAVADIAAQDKEAVDAVNSARDAMRECRATGGVWSQAGGNCQRR